MMGGQHQESLIKEQKKQDLKRKEKRRVKPPTPPPAEPRARATRVPVPPPRDEVVEVPPPRTRALTRTISRPDLPTVHEEFARESLSRGYDLPRKQVRDQASQEERARYVRPRMVTTGVGEHRVSGEGIRVGGDVGRRPRLPQQPPSPPSPRSGGEPLFQHRLRRAGEEAMRSSRPVSDTTSAEHGISQKTSVASQGSGEGAMREAPSLIVPFGEEVL